MFAKWREMLQTHEQEVYKRQVASGKVRNTILPNFGAAVDCSIEAVNEALGTTDLNQLEDLDRLIQIP